MSILDKTKTKVERVKEDLLKELVISFIKDNYYVDGSLEIRDNYNEYGKFVIDCDGDVKLTNEELTSLTDELFIWGWVKGNFYCNYSRISSLEGAPEYVNGDFYCNHSLISSLEGAPEDVKGNFSCCDTLISSLEGAPKFVGGDFCCMKLRTNFTKDDIRKVSDVMGRILI